MDTLSHALWSGVLFKWLKIKRRQFDVKLAVFWGVFPDLFAFTITTGWIVWIFVTGQEKLFNLPRPDAIGPIMTDAPVVFRVAVFLYNVSHSIIIFLIIFGLFWLIFKRPLWEMTTWLIHILIDIPTHTYETYATRFLHPFSDFYFDSFSWAEPWFIIINYSTLGLIYFFVRKKLKS